MAARSALLLATTTVQLARAALCDAVPGLNCWGNDIRDGGVVADAPACCALCTALPGCRAWTFDAAEGDPPHACWLKTSCAGARTDAQAVSGVAELPPPAPPPKGYHNGVSMGGWLVTEPSWMYDEFNAPAEADLIAQLRKQGGDAFAVTTMRNHWGGYIPDAALDALAAFGVTHARIPVGYWITEAPVVAVAQLDDATRRRRGGAYDFGFNHEGFVTGGLGYLEATLAKLKARGIRALVDVHAMPGGSSQCQSYAGWQVPAPYFWTGSPPASNATRVPACGGAGPYTSSRGAGRPWVAVGTDAVLALGAWVVGLQADPALADAVAGLEVVNEPALGTDGLLPAIEALLLDVVPKLQAAFAAGGVAANVTLNFIGPNDGGAGAWVAAQARAGRFDASRLLIDYHQYFNWDGDLTWDQLAAKMCGMDVNSSTWAQYSAAGLPVVIGEWSCSTNLGAKAYTDLSNPAVVAHLRTLYANQISLFAARGGAAPGPVGQHHWALRMGSGWDPRPTADAPAGRQVPGTAWDTSAGGFGPAVWSLGELIRVGVARPLAALNITGVCRCDGCGSGG